MSGSDENGGAPHFDDAPAASDLPQRLHQQAEEAKRQGEPHTAAALAALAGDLAAMALLPHPFEQYELILHTLAANGHAAADEVCELVRPQLQPEALSYLRATAEILQRDGNQPLAQGVMRVLQREEELARSRWLAAGGELFCHFKLFLSSADIAAAISGVPSSLTPAMCGFLRRAVQAAGEGHHPEFQEALLGLVQLLERPR
jgi:hypothetical protein